MKTIYLVIALVFISLPLQAADYVYSKAERARLKQKVRGHPWRGAENIYTNPVVPPNLDPDHVK